MQHSNGSAITAVHLDRVPFSVRQATVDDAAALHRLQGHLPDKALHSRLSIKTIQILLKANSPWNWVAEVDGNLVAAILVGKSGCDSDSSALEFKLVAVHPALEERAEVLFALLNFVIQLIIADPGIHELLQGNLKMSGLQEHKDGIDGGNAGGIAGAPDGVIARFKSTKLAPGKFNAFNNSVFHSLSSLPSLQTGGTGKNKTGGGSSTSTVTHREASFTAGTSLDDIAWIIGQVTTVTKLEAPYLNGRKSGNSGEAAPGIEQTLKNSEHGAGGHRRPTDAGRRRSKLVSIVEEARRLTSSIGFNDPSTY